MTALLVAAWLAAGLVTVAAANSDPAPPPPARLAARPHLLAVLAGLAVLVWPLLAVPLLLALLGRAATAWPQWTVTAGRAVKRHTVRWAYRDRSQPQETTQ